MIQYFNFLIKMSNEKKQKIYIEEYIEKEIKILNKKT